MSEENFLGRRIKSRCQPTHERCGGRDIEGTVVFQSGTLIYILYDNCCCGREYNGACENFNMASEGFERYVRFLDDEPRWCIEHAKGWAGCL